jgi:hypothetical protein
MKIFQCQACGQVLHFENTRCESCGRTLGYLAEDYALSALEHVPEEGHPGPERGARPPEDATPPTTSQSRQAWQVWGRPGPRFHFCANAALRGCNWLVPADTPGVYCTACRHNRIVPDLSVPQNLLRWQKLEVAKHRLFYGLTRLNLPLLTRAKDPAHGLAFDFLAFPLAGTGPKVMTGHEDGLITIALTEADDAERERMRLALGESYRTLLGHFRHEVGHWFWDVLVRDGPPGRLDAFRAHFGDDRMNYEEALKAHYAKGSPPNWFASFITPYASSHPWEDWAETWAHYLHIVDTLETAHAFGLRVRPRIAQEVGLSAEPEYDAYAPGHDIQCMVHDWLPLTFAMNSLNRSMGLPDLYPFILSPGVIEKLGFVHQLVHGRDL